MNRFGTHTFDHHWTIGLDISPVLALKLQIKYYTFVQHILKYFLANISLYLISYLDLLKSFVNNNQQLILS